MSDFEASDELGYSVKEYRALMREDELQAKRRKRQCERELAEIYGDELLNAYRTQGYHDGDEPYSVEKTENGITTIISRSVSAVTEKFSVTFKTHTKTETISLWRGEKPTEWAKRYEDSYVDENGVRLGVWLSAMRQRKRQGRLSYSPEQIARLNALGMRWTNRHNARWENGFEHAREYFRARHTLLVPPSYVSADGFKLGDWVANQREKYRAGTLGESQRDRLEEIGMPWELPDPWEVRYRLAERYYRENGNLNVPANYVADGVWLGRWLDEQRKKTDRLTPDQMKRLDALGMNWTGRFDAAWDETLEEAKTWLEREGDIPMDAVSRRGHQLRKWLQANRRKAAKGELSPERAKRISAVVLPEKKKPLAGTIRPEPL